MPFGMTKIQLKLASLLRSESKKIKINCIVIANDLKTCIQFN